MIHTIFTAECDYCHAPFAAGPSLQRLIVRLEGMRSALRNTGWYCGEGSAPQVLCQKCKHLKEEET